VLILRTKPLLYADLRRATGGFIYLTARYEMYIF
jgi:hypothetical protein